jgi:cell division protein FtsB
VKDTDEAPLDAPRPLDRKPGRPDSRAEASARTVADAPAEGSTPMPDVVDLSGLSVAGITRRRVGWIAAGLLSIWIVVVFARQVGDATTAANRAADMAIENAALAAEVEALRNEVAMIVEPAFVAQQARGHGLGTPREIPFTLDPSVPAPVDGAPGSASVRLGANDDRQSPLEVWLSLLFGPGS